MISLNDIIQENETRGELRLRLSARALLRALIVIGQLPRSRARSELLAAYEGRDDSHNDFYRLIPRGFGVERDLRAADVEEPFALTNLSVSVKAGQLCLLIGEVGSGKSSVLQLLLGEMLVCSGGLRVSTEGGIGYVPQHAWIVNASVRDNILLGRAFDEAWYSEVLGCVCLGVDLASFPTGDRTESGERGVTVSGGQKARISLARALYGKPALLLLDDPLSAVDMHMAHHLVDVALLRVARRTLGCTVVLATHQLQFVHELADQVV